MEINEKQWKNNEKQWKNNEKSMTFKEKQWKQLKKQWKHRKNNGFHWFLLKIYENHCFLKVFIDFHWFGEDRAQKGLEINIDLDPILDHPKRGQVPRGQEINIDLDDTLEVVFVVSG